MSLLVPQLEEIRGRDVPTYEALQKIVDAINSMGARLKVDPAPAPGTVGQSLAPPNEPLALAVTGAGGTFNYTVTPHPANTTPIEYFLEASAADTFDTVAEFPLGQTTQGAITLGNVIRYWRCRAKYAESDFSIYLTLNDSSGDPLAVNGGAIAAGDVEYAGGSTVEALEPAAAGADVTAANTAAAIAGQGALATKSDVDLATGEVTNKTAANIAETGSRKWLPELARIFTNSTKKTNVEGLENAGIFKAVKFNQANFGIKTLANNLLTASTAGPATGWVKFSPTTEIDVPDETASLELQMVLPAENTSGSRRVSTGVDNIGFSITSGAGPATPQVSRQGDGSLTQNSPVKGAGLTLTVYVNFTTGSFTVFPNAKINQDTLLPVAIGKVT